jgi:hypothetical protein
MLYFGVHFSRWHLKITALSDGFAIIDVLDLPCMHAKKVLPWANALKNCPEEPTQWFIDENDFYNPDFPTEIFHFHDHTYTVFLVNHRALCELMQFIEEFTLVLHKASQFPQADFFLACAIRLFHKNHCQKFASDAMPF